MGVFVRRLLALTAVWLLATAALTYAAAQRMNTIPPATTPATTTTAAPSPLTVPNVLRQPYVFAESTLSDAGFAWHVKGSAHGYASNLVVSQTPAPGTRVVDTGLPTIVLRLSAGRSQTGTPEDSSPGVGTAIRLVDAPVAKPKSKLAAARTVKPAAAAKKAPVKKAPAKKAPAEKRPPAFVVPGARREPLDEMPLPDRAKLLLRWLAADPKPTNANVQHWLYQHAWIVAGARLGWWHGADALQTLVRADDRVWQLWGIGHRSEAQARTALAEVRKRSR
jgi:PASTA domain